MKNSLCEAAHTGKFHLKITLLFALIIALTNCKSETKEKENEALASERNEQTKTDLKEHVRVFYEAGKYGGWPANWGAWNWGDEILVGFTYADHKDKEGHTFDVNTAYSKFARSYDGGQTWEIEDAFEKGITRATFEHNLGEESEEAARLEQPIDFENPDFAMTFRAETLRDGPSSFYYTYDRGAHWEGPFRLNVDFPGRSPAGIVSRTDYVVDGKNEMTAFLTVGFRTKDKDWREVACVRTTDGGRTWKHLSWIAEKEVNSIMPSSVRLGPSKLLSVIRQTKPPRMVAYLSEDNGSTWEELKDPVPVDSNGNPPALLQLPDGRLCLVYGIRKEETMPDGIGMYVAYSDDEGMTWGTPELLRGKDGAVWDIGYPRSVLLPDGKVVALYYYNNANDGDKYRYIAATIFDPK